MQRVNAAIGELRRHARLCRIIAPAHARVVGVSGVGVVAVGKFGHNQPHLANIASRHHGTHMAHKGIARVAIVHRTNLACGMRGFHQISGFILRHGQGLFAQNVEACREECFGDFVMGSVGRSHCHQINAVGAVTLTFQHLAPIAVGAVSGQP